MYKLYNFHLLNNSRPSQHLKISPDNVVQSQNVQPQNVAKPLLMSRNFLSIITNATAGKSCSSCGGGVH